MKVVLHSIERRDDGLIDLAVAFGDDSPKMYFASYDGSHVDFISSCTEEELFFTLSELAHKRFGNCVVYQLELMGILGALDRGEQLPEMPAQLGTTSFCTLRPNFLRVVWNKFTSFLYNMGIYRPKTYIDWGAPAIIQMVQRGSLRWVKRILANDPSALTETDRNGDTAVDLAILGGHCKIAIYLIEQEFPIDLSTDAGHRLLKACLSLYCDGQVEILKYLLDRGVDPNAAIAGLPAICEAVTNGMPDRVRLLAEHGARLDSRNDKGQTPLEIAEACLTDSKDPVRRPFLHGSADNPKQIRDYIVHSQQMVDLLKELENEPA